MNYSRMLFIWSVIGIFFLFVETRSMEMVTPKKNSIQIQPYGKGVAYIDRWKLDKMKVLSVMHAHQKGGDKLDIRVFRCRRNLRITKADIMLVSKALDADKNNN